MVRCGLDEEAIGFLKKTRGMSRMEARIMIAALAKNLGMI